MQTIESKGLSAGSLFKLLFSGLVLPFVIIGFFCGLGSLLGYDVVSLNQEYVHGIPGLITGIGIGLAIPLMMSSILWIIMSIGLWMITRFKKITLKIKE